VHGIPKALESVIGYLQENYPEISLAQLMEDPEFFADFDRHDKERGLKSLVDKQYASQPPDAKLVLCALSIFQQPAPREVLEFLLPGISRVSLAKLLSRLERNRLVISQEAKTYNLHPIVREYVYESMPEGQDGSPPGGSDAAPAVLTRAALHARAVAFYRKLVEEHPERRTIDDFEPHLQEIYHLLRARQYDVGFQVLEIIAEEYLRALGDYQRIIGVRQQLVECLAEPALARRNLNHLALAYDVTGRVREGIACLQDALRIARDMEDQHGEAECLSNLGHCYCHVGELRQAVDYCTQALALDRTLFNLWGEGVDMGTLGWAHWHLGDLHKAIELYTGAVERVDRRFRGLFRSNLGRIHTDLGDLRRAIEELCEAIDIAQAGKDWSTRCLALADLGYAWLLVGNVDRAIALANEARKSAAQIPLPRGELRAMLCLGRQHALAGEAREAAEVYAQAVQVARETGDLIYLASALVDLGRSCHQDGNLAEARRCYQEALALDLPRSNYRSAVLLGIACLEQGAAGPASTHLAGGLELCRAMVAKTPEFYEAWYHMGLAQFALGQNEAALASYRQAVGVCSAQGAVDGALQDLQLLGRAKDCGPAIRDAVKALEAASEPASSWPCSL
jgi:tetratricopeptide (TPR) repeat protein